ncbi:major facilitator superfamily-domain-containing protein [Polychytrium aggregatum]|uniref:major facilitator superfamily-domain-containing protein n=1 Tax=Polychytrium aggregatum TaxID=110093 RepID=UPI0022FEECE2|nr:major facilitator superfamily-domain-containing protein [Polychytrium aggregatum]KAI9199624.1 major facilitator superfamily-domain-containing protein [Polychytrium aggregatum]
MSNAEITITDADNTVEVVKTAELDAPAPVEQPNVVVTRVEFVGIMASLSLLLFAASLLATIVATALPSIAHDLNDLADYAWVATAYLLTSTTIQPLSGVLSDIFGRKACIVFASAVFLVATIVSAVSVNMIMLIVARGIMGIGGGIIFSVVYVIIADIVIPKKRGIYQGMIGGIFSIATVIGPIIGGYFTDSSAGWRWCFYVIIPLAAISLIAIVIFMKFPKPSGSLRDKIGRLDVWGTLAICFSVVLFLLALTWGGTNYSWDSGIIIGLLVGGVVLIAVFFVVEAKIPRVPIMPLDLFKYRNFNTSNIIAFTIGFQLYGCIFFIPLYFQVVHGSNATQAGLGLLPLVLTLTLASILSGILTSRFGFTKALVIPGMALLTISVGLFIILDAGSSRALESTFLGMMGFAAGLCMQTVTVVVQGSLPVPRLAAATATNTFFRTFGGVFGVALFQTILTTRFESSLVQRLGPKALSGSSTSFDPTSIASLPPSVQGTVIAAFVDGFHSVWIVTAAVVGFGFIVALFMKSVDWSKSSNTKKDASPSQSLDNTAVEAAKPDDTNV